MIGKHSFWVKLFAICLICCALIITGCEEGNETGTGDDGGDNGGNGGGGDFDYSGPPTTSYTAGTQMTLDHVDGLYDDTSLATGQSILFHIRLNNNTGSSISGLSHGFVVYSFEDAARWDTAFGGFTSNVDALMFDGGRFTMDQIIGDGAHTDTVAFGGFKIVGTGIPPGFNDIAFTIGIGPIDVAYHGKWLCFDTTYYPPGGAWLWSLDTGSLIPDWDGARWFRIVDPLAK